MTFYILLLIFSVIIAYKADKHNSPFLLIVLMLLFSLTSGLRGEKVGIDTVHYITIWERLMWEMPVYQEIGFQWLIKGLQHLGKSPSILFLFCSFVTYTLFIKVCWQYRKLSSFHIAVMILFMLVFLRSMNVVRQFLAVAILFYAISFYFKKKYWHYVIGVLIATLFHTTSLVCFLLLGFDLWNSQRSSIFKKVLISIVILLGVYCFSYLYAYFQHEYGMYFENQSNEFGLLTLASIICLIISYIVTLRVRIRNKNEEERALIKKITVLYALGLILASLDYVFLYAGRVGLPFSVFGMLYYGILYKNCKNDFERWVYLLFAFIVIGWPFVSAMLTNGYGTNPYNFDWIS